MWYSVGVISIAANGTTATGTGTAFLSNVRVGDALTVAGTTSLYQVTNIASDTQLTFSPAFGTTASGSKAYAVVPVQGYQKDLADQVKLLLNTYGNIASSPSLAAFSTVVGGTNLLAYFTSATTMATTAFSPFSRTILDDVDASSVRNTIGVTSTTDLNTALGLKANTTDVNTALGLKANLASPALTGTPTAPTQTAGNNTTRLATTAFVATAVSPLATLASPIFTGDPQAPTATVGDNDTSIATTAFVQSAMAAFGLGSLVPAVTDANTLAGGVTTFFRAASAASNTPVAAAIAGVYVGYGATAGVMLCGTLSASATLGNTLWWRCYNASAWGTWYPIARAGANSDITSLTGLTTALSVAQGGTGVTTTASLLTALNTAGAYSKTNIVGTVSQTSSVPTGAIIERGTNANGDYVRYADGTQICWKTITTTTGTSTVVGAIYGSDALGQGSFPASFSALPNVTHSGYISSGNVNGMWSGCYTTPTQTSWGNYRLLAAGAYAAGFINVVAVGRWY